MVGALSYAGGAVGAGEVLADVDVIEADVGDVAEEAVDGPG